MKATCIYLACALAIFVGVVLVLCGGLWPVVGLAWFALLYISGLMWPRLWRSFWRSNMRVLAYFNCL